MTVATSDRIEKRLTLRAPRARVWRAIADAGEFGKWFGVELSGPFTPGARRTGKITTPGYEHLPFDITVDRIEPERVIAFRWHPGMPDPAVDYTTEPTTLIVFELADAPGGTLLTLVESGFDRLPPGRRESAFRDNDEGWTSQVKNIEEYVARNA
jgi:uncharacterized protein YndB with AHSA1/START domain